MGFEENIEAICGKEADDSGKPLVRTSKKIDDLNKSYCYEIDLPSNSWEGGESFNPLGPTGTIVKGTLGGGGVP